MGGKFVAGSAIKHTARGRRLRRRVVFCIVVLIVVALIRGGVYWARQPSPLTTLSSSEFNLAFEEDLAGYREFDEGLDNNINYLATHKEMFDPASGRVLTADEETMLRDAWTTVYDYAFALEYDQPRQQLDFVCFLDGREKDQTAVVATKQDFLVSYQRTKWCFAQE